MKGFNKPYTESEEIIYLGGRKYKNVQIQFIDQNQIDNYFFNSVNYFDKFYQHCHLRNIWTLLVLQEQQSQ